MKMLSMVPNSLYLYSSFLGRRLHAMQGVSLKLVADADKDHLATVYEVSSTKPQIFSTT